MNGFFLVGLILLAVSVGEIIVARTIPLAHWQQQRIIDVASTLFTVSIVSLAVGVVLYGITHGK